MKLNHYYVVCKAFESPICVIRRPIIEDDLRSSKHCLLQPLYRKHCGNKITEDNNGTQSHAVELDSKRRLLDFYVTISQNGCCWHYHFGDFRYDESLALHTRSVEYFG
jgi:hypothetical protein